MGLDPTVEEIDHLGSLFKQYIILHLYNNEPPKSFIKHKNQIFDNTNDPSGGFFF